MSGRPVWSGTRRVLGVFLVTLVAGAMAALAAGPAAAYDEEGESDQASVLVLQAIALIVNKPDDMDHITEKIDDALNAPDTEGVDLDLVQQAMDAMDAEDMVRARSLLEHSLLPAEAKPPAVGDETGTTVVLDPLDPRGHLDFNDWVWLVVSAAVAALGVLMATMWRPAQSVRELRRRLSGPAQGS